MGGSDLKRRPARVVQRAELLLRGQDGRDVDLHEVTRLLGVQPTKLWRAGEALPSGRRHASSVWWWESGDVADRDSDAVVRAVLDRFDPVAVRAACRDLALTAHVGIVVEMYGDVEHDESGHEVRVPTPSLSFDAETIERIAAFGAEFEVDQYVVVEASGT